MTKTPQDKDIVFVANPLSKEQGILRPQLISGLIKCVAYNLNHQQSDLRLFELGKTFPSSKEEQTLGIIMTGRCCRDWLRRESKLTFFDLKGVLETLFFNFGH
jgi:phenylalanyl-tRNA synthetase beta chain